MKSPQNLRLSKKLCSILMLTILWVAVSPSDSYQIARAQITAVHFAIVGDYGHQGQPEADVATLIKSWNPDFVVTTGDNNYGGTIGPVTYPPGSSETIDANIGQYYQEFISPYTGVYGSGGATNMFFPVMGNHDWETTNGQAYFDYFSLPNNERYYDFVQGPIHFFMVDSDPSEPDGNTSTSVQGDWLRNALLNSTDAWNIVLLHHAPFSSSSVHGSNPTSQWPFQAWGADAVVAGHDHTYERVLQNNFPYFVNGLGGYSVYGFGTPVSGSAVRYNADYGAMLVDADSATLTFKFINRVGNIIDTYTIDKTQFNGSRVLSLRPGLDWNDVPGATSYTIQISRLSTFGKLVQSVNTTVSNYTPTKDLPINSTLYWRYRANVGTTPGAWSTVDSFSTGAPPSIPVLSLPRPKQLVTNFTPLLQWGPVSVPIGPFLKYQVQVDNNLDFSSPEVDDSSVTNVLASQLTSPASLDPDSIYYWRVRAFNSLITGDEYSSWSKVRYLRTSILPPALSSPADTATLNNLRPSFTWTATNALSYTIEISNVADFSYLVLNKKTALPSYALSFDLLPGTPYFWRVRVYEATPGHFGPSGYSTIYNFTTGNPPAIPVLISPANTSSTTIHSPMFNWSDVPAFGTFDHYEIQIATDNLFTNILYGNDTTSSQDNAAVLSIGKYYWRVRSWTTTDYSSWSKVFAVTIK